MQVVDTITENFITAVKWLKNTGKIKLDKELIDQMEWDKSNYSATINGRKKLPVVKMLAFLKGYPFNNFDQKEFNPSVDFTGKHEINNGADTLLNLAESNRVLAQSNLVFAEAHKRIADTNAELTLMLKANLTVDVAIKNQADGPSTFDKILEAVAVIASGKKWATKEAAEKALRTLVFGDQAKLSKANTYHE